ncbi:MAG: nuclear transport factor 2 family protein [Steroidobacteraceae bacterium]
MLRPLVQSLRWRSAVLVIVTAAVTAAAPAVAVPPGGPLAGGTMTRGVAQYQELEQRLADALADGNRGAAEALLAEEFAFLAPGPGDPLDRRQYLDSELAHRAAAPRVYALNVLGRGEFDVVSGLIRVDRRMAGQQRVTVLYVVDLWRRADHRLVTRHASVPRHAPPAPTAPTGRE